MQIDLAMAIFERVFGERSKGSRFRLVAGIDWSQGHAAFLKDALVAESMNVNPGGKSAQHLRHTFWPKTTANGFVVETERQQLCTPGCELCIKAVKEHGHRPDFQSIGKKGLLSVLKERGIPVVKENGKKMIQGELVAALEQCSDFSPQHARDRAAVTEQMSKRGHLALFGVKYHAELAAIERKWMWLKQRGRKYLDGKLATLKRLLWQCWKVFTVDDARKAMRHCRDTLRAYKLLAQQEVTLDGLKEEEIKMKGHRRVFDGADNLLKLKAGIELTVHQKMIAHRTAIARTNRADKAKFDARNEAEWKSRMKRKSANRQTAEKQCGVKAASKRRLSKASILRAKGDIRGYGVKKPLFTGQRLDFSDQ